MFQLAVGEGNANFHHESQNLGTILLPFLAVAWSKRALDLQATLEADTREDFLVQGWTKRLRPSLVNLRRKIAFSCLLQPGKRNFSSSNSPNLAKAF